MKKLLFVNLILNTFLSLIFLLLFIHDSFQYDKLIPNLILFCIVGIFPVAYNIYLCKMIIDYSIAKIGIGFYTLYLLFICTIVLININNGFELNGGFVLLIFNIITNLTIYSVYYILDKTYWKKKQFGGIENKNIN